MDRPTGITILAIFGFLFGLLMAGLAALMFVGSAFLGTMLGAAAAEGGEAAAGAGMMGVVVGFSAVIGGVMLVYFAVGYGLWKLKNWARIITIVLSDLGAALDVLGLLGSLMAFGNYQYGFSARLRGDLCVDTLVHVPAAREGSLRVA